MKKTGTGTGIRTGTGIEKRTRTSFKTGTSFRTGTGIEKRTRTSFRTGTSFRTETKKILAYCHSQTHEEIKDSKIINTLNINQFDEIDTCDLYEKHPNDINIDLSKKILTTNDIAQFNKYDIIYLVNCPYHVYINDDTQYNEILFKNLFTLLNVNGVIITRIARSGIEELTLKTIDDIQDVKEALTNAKKIEELLNLRVEMYKTYLTSLNICKKLLQNFFTENKIGLRILRIESNSKYIKSGLNGSGLMKNFIVIKRYL